MKLTLAEIATMFDELNGRIIDQKTGERSKTGLLSQKLSIKVKYILNNQINKKLADERKAYDESYIEIFKGMVDEGKGENKDGMYFVPEEHNAELRSRLAELEKIEKDVEVPDLDVEELFNIETEDYYPILLEKFLKKAEVPTEPKP
jgi:hypothetical protein